MTQINRALFLTTISAALSGCCWTGKQAGYFVEPSGRGPIIELSETRPDLGFGQQEDMERSLRRIIQRDYVGSRKLPEFMDLVDYYDGTCASDPRLGEHVCRVQYSFIHYGACDEPLGGRKVVIDFQVKEENGVIQKLDPKMKITDVQLTK